MTAWIEPLTLFVQDRDKFNEKYANEPRTIALCNKMFLVTESRPQVAEHIAITIMGHTICDEKKYDGMIVDNGHLIRYSEYKVTCRRIGEDGKYTSMSSIQINDVSAAIVARYVADQPLFVFPYFLEGHLAAMFSVDFSVIEPKYKNFLATNTKAGRPSFTLALSDWLDQAKVEFVHADNSIVEQLSPTLQRKIYQSTQRSNTMQGIVKFPQGHKFEHYGYNFDTDRVVSYIRHLQGQDRSDKTGIKILGIGYVRWQDLKAEAEILSGVPVSNPSVPRAVSVPALGIYTHKASAASIPQPKKMFVTFTREFPATMSMAQVQQQLNSGDAELKITFE